MTDHSPKAERIRELWRRAMKMFLIWDNLSFEQKVEWHDRKTK